MDVRRTAAILLVTLLMPFVLSGVCDARCVHHEHHGTQAAAEPSCHEQRPSSQGAGLTDGTSTLCHEQTPTVASTAADVRLPNAAPVIIQLPSALAPARPQAAVQAPPTALGPPDIVTHTTPLRI
jgi:hypothetical protein